MAQIPQYARKSLVSSYVGAPVHSHKADVTAAAGEGLTRLSAAVGAQLDATAKQQAATALYKYQQNYTQALAGTKEKQGLADQHADDPLSLPQAALRMGEELASEMANGLNKRARTEFDNSVKGFLMSENRRITGLAVTQNKANQVVAMEEGLTTLSDSAAYTTDLTDMTQVVDGLYDTAFTVDDGGGAISPKARASLFAKSFNTAKRNFVNGKLMQDPVGFATELNAGEYSSISIKGEDTPFINATEAKRYISAARSIAKNREEQQMFEFAISNGEMALELIDRFNNGMLSLTDIDDLEFQARELKQNHIADMYGSFKDILLNGNDAKRMTDTAWFTGVSEDLLILADKRKSKKISPQQRLKRGFEIITEANKKFAANELTRSDYELINASVNSNIFVPVAKSSSSTTPFLAGLEQIRGHMQENMKGISESERLDLFTDAMRDYYGVIREVGMDKVTEEQAKVASKRAIEAMKARARPEFSSLEVGDMVPTPTGARKMIGRDGIGNPILEFTGEDVRKLNY
ncbi:MAG: hypothetical protein EOL91_04200 [Actinobacteria bacterium]|nr:hypothetical protein [Actinomycetota bacterium]